jgi:hypothetical protein
MHQHGINTMIRPDMQQPTGITVWQFIQCAAELGLCPKRAKEQWFDKGLPSMQKKRRTDDD